MYFDSVCEVSNKRKIPSIVMPIFVNNEMLVIAEVSMLCAKLITTPIKLYMVWYNFLLNTSPLLYSILLVE